MNRVSRVFQPLNIVPKNAVLKKELTSKSQKLMTELGLIRPAHNGTFYLLPMLQRAVTKMTSLVDKHMASIDAQRMSLPVLTSSELWSKTGRLESIGREIMTSVDRHNHSQILSPTGEESVTALIASLSPISYKQLPLRLYQVGLKFRDEMKPRFGLIRAKEFIMKDLYTFDADAKRALLTYQLVNDSYAKLFTSLKFNYMKVNACPGSMGGEFSHEYHLPATIGDDTLIKCNKCGHSTNKEIVADDKNCEKCQSKDLETTQGIEIGHTFLLNDKYSKTLEANVVLDDGSVLPLFMGCFGIGVTRVVAASIEALSTDTEIRWPPAIAPYLICLIPPKGGSREESLGQAVLEQVYKEADKLPQFSGNVMVDDRVQLTIGKRLLMAKKMGYPLVVVIGSKILDETPTVELHFTNTGIHEEYAPNEIVARLSKIDCN